MTSGIGLPLPELKNDFNGLRIGTQEITRWGMQPADMPAVARLISRVLAQGEDPRTVRPDVIALRHQFQTLHYVFSD